MNIMQDYEPGVCNGNEKDHMRSMSSMNLFLVLVRLWLVVFDSVCENFQMIESAFIVNGQMSELERFLKPRRMIRLRKMLGLS